MEKKKKVFSTNIVGLTGCLHVEECKQIHTYHPAQNSTPNDHNLNIKADTLNLVEVSMGQESTLWASKREV